MINGSGYMKETLFVLGQGRGKETGNEKVLILCKATSVRRIALE